MHRTAHPPRAFAPVGFKRLRVGAMCLAVACGASGAAASTAAPAAASVPIESFFKRAALRSPALSHSGRWLAVPTSVPGKRVGFLMIDLEGDEPQRFIEAAPNADVMWFQWVNDDWLIFALEEPGRFGSDRRGPGLMSMKRDGSESKQLIRRSYDAFVGTDEPANRRRALLPNHIVVGLGTPGSREIILQELIFDVRGEYSHSTPMVLDVGTQSVRTMLEDAPRATDVLLDQQGRARVLIEQREGQISMHWSEDGNAPWRQISKTPRFENTFWPSYVDDAGGLIVETDTGTGGAAQVRLGHGQTHRGTAGRHTGIRAQSQAPWRTGLRQGRGPRAGAHFGERDR